MLSYLRRDKANLKEQSYNLYRMIVKQTRSEWFYLNLKIDDSPFGRFEVMTIHLFIVLRRLKEEKSAQSAEIAQQISNIFVVDLDHSLRDLRISETKLAKQFNKFIQGFYGRLIAYDAGIETGDEALNEAIHKNLFAGKFEKDAEITLVAAYVKTQLYFLSQQQIPQLKFKDIS